MDARTERFVSERAALWARPGPSGPQRRADYVELVDEWLGDLAAAAGIADMPVALVGVGGTGRGDLAPGSDLDLVLVHEPGAAVASLADRLWYPVWDSGLRLDHAVRTEDQVLRAVRDDLRVAVGMLDVRVITGDARLAQRLRERTLEVWRSTAPRRLVDLRRDAEERMQRSGELAHLLEPDLKDSYGGLRDAVALRAVAASWLVDVPRAGVAEATQALLDLRDALHVTTGRGADRLLLHDQSAVAAWTGVADPDDLLRSACAAGRTLAYASDVAWSRAERATRRSSRTLLRRRGSAAVRRPLAEGVVEEDSEVVLARDADPIGDVGLGLRLAAAAAQHGLRPSPATIDLLARSMSDVPDPWSRDMRESFVALLGAGSAAIPVWEALDQAGLWSRWLPGWERLRGLPQHNPVHTFTVDRHLVEAATRAASLTRSVDRPDLLLIGALLHDVGKGLPGDHCESGVPLVERWGRRMGFADDDVSVLVALCRQHLLLPDTATRRDLDDPATAASVADAVGEPRYLDLLHALTRADAMATGPLAWTDWRALLIAQLVERVHAVLRGGAPALVIDDVADHPWATSDGTLLSIEPHTGGGWEALVAADDRPGLMAAVAGVLSMNRLAVRSAMLATAGDRAIQRWIIQPEFGDPPGADQVREDLRAALAGRLDLSAKLAARERSYPRSRIAVPDPRVDVVPGASADATVLEVRAHDGPALLHRIGSAIASSGVGIRSARVSTMGAEAVDVFYLEGPGSRPLTGAESAVVVGAVLDELRDAASTR